MSAGCEVFDRDGELWWSGNSHCALLSSIIPARLYYLRRMFSGEQKKDLAGTTVLDVGCGGGLLAEELARLGCTVTGVDLSYPSIMTAQRHAARMGIFITYLVSSGEELPFQDNTFDMVCCCDVLEHVTDPGTVIAESARVLKSGGLYFFDTINRTWLSKFAMITLVQDWLRIAPKNLHDWRRFITPGECRQHLENHGLELRDMIGLMPDMKPVPSFKRLVSFFKLKRGTLTYGELADEMIFRPSRFKSLNYMGHAIK